MPKLYLDCVKISSHVILKLATDSFWFSYTILPSLFVTYIQLFQCTGIAMINYDPHDLCLKRFPW